MRAGIRIIAEALHEPLATMAEQKRAEKSSASVMQRVGVTNEKSGDIIARNVVLQKVQLQQHRGDKIYAPTLVKHLALFYIPRLKGTQTTQYYIGSDFLRIEGLVK